MTYRQLNIISLLYFSSSLWQKRREQDYVVSNQDARPPEDRKRRNSITYPWESPPGILTRGIKLSTFTEFPPQIEILHQAHVLRPARNCRPNHKLDDHKLKDQTVKEQDSDLKGPAVT